MGTVGDALDNAVAESFFATLQTELLDRQRWTFRRQLAAAIGVILDRLHEGIGDGDRDIEVGDLGRVVLAGDEIENVGVVDPEGAKGYGVIDHVG